MTLPVAIAALLAGLAVLWLGTESTIRGAVSLAHRLKLSGFVVGVAVLSIGSDIPELAVAVIASLENLRGADASDMIIGTAIGSALAQIGFVLGLTGLFTYLTIPRQLVYRHGSIMIGAIVMLGLFALDRQISRAEGAAMVTIYLIYLVFLLTEKRRQEPASSPTASDRLPRAVLFLVAGLVLVSFSAELVVTAVADIAAALSIGQSFIAVVFIAIGTSLPELSISLGAIRRQQKHMSVGNLLGSNIFDTLLPIGVAALIAPLAFGRSMLVIELPVLLLLTLTVLTFFNRKRGIQHIEAVITLTIYLTYVTLKFFLLAV